MADLGLKNTRDKLAALVLVIVAGTAFAGWNFVAKPQLKKVAEVRAEQGGDREKKELVAKIATAEKRLEAFRNRLPEKGETSWLIEALNQLSDEAGVPILAVTPIGRQPFEGYFRLPVRIEIECRYHELGAFVSRIENHPRSIRINGLRIESPRVADAPDAKLRISMTLSALYPEKELVS